MGKAKGLSFDEKRIRLLQIFHDKVNNNIRIKERSI